MRGVPPPIAVMNWPGGVPRPAGLEQGEDLGDIPRQLDLGDVVSGAIGEADEVRVALDQPGDDRASPQVDDARVAAAPLGAAHLVELPVADQHRGNDPAAVVHGVDAAVYQQEILGRFAPPRAGGVRDLRRKPDAGDRGDAGECADFKQVATRQTDAVLGGALAHGCLPMRNCSA